MECFYPVCYVTSVFNLNDFYSRFKSRHDFGDSDLIELKSKFPLINISNNVPTAWIIAIDDFLNAVKYIDKGLLDNIKCIEQAFGFISILMKKDGKISSDILVEYEQLQKTIYDLDRDLYEFFDIAV